MNHGPAFQALWKQLRAEVRALQDKGYYGDGYWSSGRRLFDSAPVAGDGIRPGDLPEFMCGGAHARARPTSIRRVRGDRNTTVETTRRRKAGTRVTSKTAFRGEGSKLVEGQTDSAGTGFRRQARSKRAREDRAMAAERRIKMLQEQSKASSSGLQIPKEESEDDESDIEIIETDAERRQALLNTEEQENDLLRLDKPNSWKEFQHEFNFSYMQRDDDGCDLPVASGSTFTSGSEQKLQQAPVGSSAAKLKSSVSLSNRKGKTHSDAGFKTLVQTEIQFRKRDRKSVV